MPYRDHARARRICAGLFLVALWAIILGDASYSHIFSNGSGGGIILIADGGAVV